MQRIRIAYFMKYEKLFVRVIHFLNESHSIRSQMQFLLAFPFPSIRLSRSSRLSFLLTTWSILFYISFRCPILNPLAGFSVDPDEHLHNLLCIRFEGSELASDFRPRSIDLIAPTKTEFECNSL